MSHQQIVFIRDDGAGAQYKKVRGYVIEVHRFDTTKVELYAFYVNNFPHTPYFDI